jgi:hypothetical protein
MIHVYGMPQLIDISANNHGAAVPVSHQDNSQGIPDAGTGPEVFDFGRGLYVLDAIDAAEEARVRGNCNFQ